MDWRSKSYSELFRESHYYYLLKCYHSVKEEIAEDTMSELHVRAWVNHIPNPENRHLPKDERWDDDVYDLAEQFLKDLYSHSLQKGYIDESTSMEDFIANRF